MAKKRKTRSMKMAADLRQQRQPSPSQSHPSISLSEIGIKPAPSSFSPSHSVTIPQEYNFVKHDLFKTSTITGAIILVELVLFFVVKL